MKKQFKKTALITAIALATGCTTAQMKQFGDGVNDFGSKHGMVALCGIGTVAGAGVGYAVSGKEGALWGGAAGAAIGCYAGHLWQTRMQELERVAKEENLNMTFQPLEYASATSSGAPESAGLVTQVEDGSMFATGSAVFTPSGKQAAQKLAAVYVAGLQKDAKGNATKADSNLQILVVGHTDATGSSALNQALSQKRAKEFGKILEAAGIPVKDIYYQGAGSSRPIADNSDAAGRAKNRRVEIVEVTSEEMLVKRAQAEEANAKYLTYGTSTKPAPTVSSASAKSGSSTSVVTTPVTTPTAKPVVKPSAAKALVDFNGVPADQTDWQLAQGITPKSGGFSLISTAQASEIPMSSCVADMPRASGEIFNMATGKALAINTTTNDYLPGYNNRVWASTVNGHLVTITPVSILRDGAKVGKQPVIQVVPDYDKNKRKSFTLESSVANAYEGETQVLYRVFMKDSKAAVSCMDVVFSKGNATAERGALFYPVGTEFYTAAYLPIKTK